MTRRQIIIEQANELLIEAQHMPVGVERDRLLERARSMQAEVEAEKWANSTGLHPPK